MSLLFQQPALISVCHVREEAFVLLCLCHYHSNTSYSNISFSSSFSSSFSFSFSFFFFLLLLLFFFNRETFVVHTTATSCNQLVFLEMSELNNRRKVKTSTTTTILCHSCLQPLQEYGMLSIKLTYHYKFSI